MGKIVARSFREIAGLPDVYPSFRCHAHSPLSVAFLLVYIVFIATLCSWRFHYSIAIPKISHFPPPIRQSGVEHDSTQRSLYLNTWRSSLFTSLFMVDFLCETLDLSLCSLVSHRAFNAATVAVRLAELDDAALTLLWHGGMGLCTSFSICVASELKRLDGQLFTISDKGRHRAAHRTSGANHIIIDSSARQLLIANGSKATCAPAGCWRVQDSILELKALLIESTTTDLGLAYLISG